MARRVLSVIACTGLALCLAVAGAVLAPNLIHAQVDDNDYVDVGITLQVPDHDHSPAGYHDLIISVVNHGSRTAYDVEVVVNLEYPEDNSQFRPAPVVPIGSASLKNNERTFKWSIPSLGGLQRAQVFVDVTNTDISGAFLWDYRNVPHEHFGQVTTSSFESKLHKGNNTARVWSYGTSPAHSHFHQAAGNYLVAVSVNKLSPSPGDTVEFTITAYRERIVGRSGFPPRRLT